MGLLENHHMAGELDAIEGMGFTHIDEELDGVDAIFEEFQWKEKVLSDAEYWTSEGRSLKEFLSFQEELQEMAASARYYIRQHAQERLTWLEEAFCECTDCRPRFDAANPVASLEKFLSEKPARELFLTTT